MRAILNLGYCIGDDGVLRTFTYLWVHVSPFTWGVGIGVGARRELLLHVWLEEQ